MLTPSDERMAKLKAAINRTRDGDLTALLNCDVTPEDLVTIGALAKATDDAFTYDLTQQLLDQMFGRT